jgi:hypothetical protein
MAFYNVDIESRAVTSLTFPIGLNYTTNAFGNTISPIDSHAFGSNSSASYPILTTIQCVDDTSAEILGNVTRFTSLTFDTITSSS